MNNIVPVYREQFDAALKEIRANKGKVHKIVGNVIYYVDGTGEPALFTPEMSEHGLMFHKSYIKDAIPA